MAGVTTPRWALGVILLVGFASVGVSLNTSHDTHHTNACLINYIAESSRVTKIRSAANMKREQAVSDLLDGVAKLTLAEPPMDPVKAKRQSERATVTYKKLLGDYRRTTAEVAAERVKNPLPNLPEKCSEVK